MPRIAIIDSQVAGIAGDMLMSSLVDAGANKTKVIDAIFACQNFVKDSTIINAHFAKVTSHGFAATQLQMNSKIGCSSAKAQKCTLHLQDAVILWDLSIEPRHLLWILLR